MQSIYIYVVNRKQFNNDSKKMETYEEVSIKNKIVERTLAESSFVLDLVNKALVKNRYEYTSENKYTYESVMEYLRKNHTNVVDVETRYNEMMASFEEKIERARRITTCQRSTGIRRSRVHTNRC